MRNNKHPESQNNSSYSIHRPENLRQSLCSFLCSLPCNRISPRALIAFLVSYPDSSINFLLHRNYGLPLHLIRELYETFRNFKIRVTDYLRYRKITSNMNDRFPDATPEELSS